MTLPLSGSVKIALQPPQKSSVQTALGNRGHVAVLHGESKQLTGGRLGGQARKTKINFVAKYEENLSGIRVLV